MKFYCKRILIQIIESSRSVLLDFLFFSPDVFECRQSKQILIEKTENKYASYKERGNDTNER